MATTYVPIDLRGIAAGSGGFALRGVDAADLAGLEAAAAGDVNSDGIDDFILGATGADGTANAEPQTGEAYVIFGTRAGFPATLNLATIAAGQGGFVIRGEDPGDGAGRNVGLAGDVNGDGFDDLFIGAQFADGPGNLRPAAGATYVVFGTDQGFGATIDLADIAAGTGGFVIQGGEARGWSGFGANGAGDIDGDGFDDLVVGAVDYGGLGVILGEAAGAGRAYVVFGRAEFGAAVDLRDVATGSGGFAVTGTAPPDRLGYSVGPAGDVNGDGFDDVILGAPDRDGPIDDRFAAGVSYVIFGGNGPRPAEVALADLEQGIGGFAIQGELATDFSGARVDGAGDVNGDGIDDLLIGAAFERPRGFTGKAFVVFGRTDPFPPVVDLALVAQGLGGFAIRADDAGDVTGFSLGAAGDLNGDGIGDIVIGTWRSDGPGEARQNAGGAYVIFGRDDGFPAEIRLAEIAAGTGGFVIDGEDRLDQAGSSAEGAGDVNGDGFDDLIIGAYRAEANGGPADAGAAYIVFGGAFVAGPLGTPGDDGLAGGRGAEGIDGLAGDDLLRGRGGDDTLIGGDGRDRLSGGSGADVLSGGEGKDRFRFGDNALGATDRILDFKRDDGDRIILRPIDADTASAADDPFTFIGTTDFTRTAGELRWEDRGGGVRRIEGDVDGDGLADLTIDVIATAPVAADWFAL